MGRKKATAMPTIETMAAAEPQSQPPINGDKPMSKMDAVRRAIAEGINSPKEVVEYAKTRFGLEMSSNQVSNYKTHLKGASGIRKQKVKATANGNGVAFVPNLLVLKGLVKEYGADEVRSMVSLFE